MLFLVVFKLDETAKSYPEGLQVGVGVVYDCGSLGCGVCRSIMLGGSLYL